MSAFISLSSSIHDFFFNFFFSFPTITAHDSYCLDDEDYTQSRGQFRYQSSKAFKELGVNTLTGKL